MPARVAVSWYGRFDSALSQHYSCPVMAQHRQTSCENIPADRRKLVAP